MAPTATNRPAIGPTVAFDVSSLETATQHTVPHGPAPCMSNLTELKHTRLAAPARAWKSARPTAIAFGHLAAPRFRPPTPTSPTRSPTYRPGGRRTQQGHADMNGVWYGARRRSGASFGADPARLRQLDLALRAGCRSPTMGTSRRPRTSCLATRWLAPGTLGRSRTSYPDR